MGRLNRLQALKGKVVKAISGQIQDLENHSNTKIFELESIQFTDGTILVLTATETDYEPIVRGSLITLGMR